MGIVKEPGGETRDSKNVVFRYSLNFFYSKRDIFVKLTLVSTLVKLQFGQKSEIFTFALQG